MATELRTYETICLTKIDMPDDKYEALLERAKSAILGEGKGEWLTTDDWGKAKVSYAIGKEKRARWTYMRYRAYSPGVDELRRGLSINEFVLRQQTVVTRDDGSDYESLKATIAQDIADRDRPRDWREERGPRGGGLRDREAGGFRGGDRDGPRGPRRDFVGGGGYGAPDAGEGMGDEGSVEGTEA